MSKRTTIDTWQPTAGAENTNTGHPGYPVADAAADNSGPLDTPETESLPIMNEVPGYNYGAVHTGSNIN